MDLTGQTLGKYKLMRRLGQGGMAQVYYAVQPGIERPVAVKVLYPHLAQSADFRMRFGREARSLGQLRHPGIVGVIDYDTAGDTVYLVMEYVEGQTLRELLDMQGKLPLGDALALGARVATVIAYAHSQGTIHRDLKPDNILLRNSDPRDPVITDFGVASLLDDLSITQAGALLGTPAYMSPEAVRGEPTDARSDLYSLGALLYETVTGRTPFEGDTLHAQLIAQTQAVVRPPHLLNPALPLVLDGLLLKALAKAPADRYQNGNDFGEAVQQIRGLLGLGAATTLVADLRPELRAALLSERGETATATAAAAGDAPKPPQPPAAAKTAGAGGRGWLPLIGAGVLLLLLVTAGVLFLRNGDDTPPLVVVPTGTQAATETAAPTAAIAQATDVIAPTADATSADTTTAPPVATPTENITPAAIETAPAAATVAADPTAAPTDAPTPTPTATATATPTPAAYGLLQLGREEGDGNLALSLERIVQPPAGQTYALWLAAGDGTFAPVAPFTPLPLGSVDLRISVAPALLADLDGVLISVEQTGALPDTPSDAIALRGTWPAGASEALSALLGLGGQRSPLQTGLAQARIAAEHTELALDAVAQNNFAEMRMHTEHVLNILVGEEDPRFGDLDRNGLAENPGDGIGVVVYVQRAVDLIAALGPAAGGNDRAAATLQTVDDAIRLIIRVASTDSTGEAAPVLADLQTVFGELTDDELPALTAAASSFGRISLLAEAALPVADVPPAAPLSAPALLQIVATGRLEPLGYQLTLSDWDAPAGDYALYALDAQNDGARLIDVIRPRGGRQLISGRVAFNLLDFAAFAITQVNGTPAADEISGRVLLRGSLADESAVTAVFRDIAPPPFTALSFIETQHALAVEHYGLAVAAHAAGDRVELRMHLEHIVNILDGEEGDLFGDLDRNGLAENPGDGVGVRGYLRYVEDRLGALDDEATLRADQVWTLALLNATADNALALNLAAMQAALRILATDTLAEAAPLLPPLGEAIAAISDGADANDDGTIDPLRGEGAAAAIFDYALALVAVPLE